MDVNDKKQKRSRDLKQKMIPANLSHVNFRTCVVDPLT